MTLKRIGAGFCGSVWAVNSEAISKKVKDHAIKREDGGPGRSLYNEYIMHQRILSTLASTDILPSFYIPACHQYVESEDSTWWFQNVSRFPPAVQIACNVLITDRVQPFPTAVRNEIIDAYCPESLKASIKNSEPDQDCLVRPYLGRRRRLERQSRFKAFSLRNYPLHIDQMEDMGLDITLYSRVMAEVLAHLYWMARIDADDVEFVLAPPRTNDGLAETLRQQIFNSQALGRHAIWLLDFDCCRSMTMDEERGDSGGLCILQE